MGLQAYSRTNRIVNEQKSQGNIVVFRNLKKATDDAITLFSNKEAIEEIIIEPYEDYVKKFNDSFIELLKITPTVNSVNNLQTEEDELAFIKAFRNLMRIKNTLVTFSDFNWDDLEMLEQLFEDYKSKYLDLYYKIKTEHDKEKVSILEDVDFEMEFIHRDEINVAYIIQLLIELKQEENEDTSAIEKEVFNLLNTDTRLRSKREFIEEFIKSNLPNIENAKQIKEEFNKFWTAKQEQAFIKLTEEENLVPEATTKLIDNFLYAEREPLSDDVLASLAGEQPTLLLRKKTGNRILKKILNFVDTFIDGLNM